MTRGCGVKEAFDGTNDNGAEPWCGDDGCRWGVIRAVGKGEDGTALTAHLAVHCGDEGRRRRHAAGESRMAFVLGAPTSVGVGRGRGVSKCVGAECWRADSSIDPPTGNVQELPLTREVKLRRWASV